MVRSLQSLLSGIIDYAGLFPPAHLSLPEAVALYHQGRRSPYRWMLDRFVIPASRLSELIPLLAASGPSERVMPCSLSVLLSPQWESELQEIDGIQKASEAGWGIAIQSMEVAPLEPTQIPLVSAQLPADVTAFFEIPWNADLKFYLQGLHQTGSAAKLRTGGITPDAFPSASALAQRILELAQAGMPFKATAGLHHPWRGNHALTYQPDSPVGPMHGFLNVAMLAALAYQQTISLEQAIALLEESSGESFRFQEEGMEWGDRSLSLAELTQSRQFFRSFGSCSFQEPIHDLQTSGLL